MKKNVLALSIASALSFMAMERAHAAGFALYEQGISGMGNAYAGAAAVAEDATTVWWNPAGMSRLPKGMNIAVGGAAIMPSWKFSDKGSVAALGQPLGGNGGDAGDTAFVPSAFFAMSLNPAWSFGVGISVPFGLKTEYDPSWLGRFQGIKSEVQTVNVNPAVSYKLSDAVSLGFGVSYQRGKIDLVTGANYTAAGASVPPALGGPIPIAPGTEGQNTTSLDGDAWGFNVGALFNVAPATRVGVHYRSQLDYSLDGNTSFSNRPASLGAVVPDGNVKLDLKTPDNLAVSVAHRINDQLELLADVTWWHWSVIKSQPVVRTDGAQNGRTLSTLTFNFDDTYRLSIGANYKLSQPWTLKVGLAYDQTPVPNAESRTVRLPDSDRYWLSFGAKYQASPKDVIDVGYVYIKASDADINNVQNNPAAGQANGNVIGTYKASVNVFGLQYQHTF
jgi:long-chain fatty acid transport protein